MLGEGETCPESKERNLPVHLKCRYTRRPRFLLLGRYSSSVSVDVGPHPTGIANAAAGHPALTNRQVQDLGDVEKDFLAHTAEPKEAIRKHCSTHACARVYALCSPRVTCICSRKYKRWPEACDAAAAVPLGEETCSTCATIAHSCTFLHILIQPSPPPAVDGNVSRRKQAVSLTGHPKLLLWH